jgi:hypothetical protein
MNTFRILRIRSPIGSADSSDLLSRWFEVVDVARRRSAIRRRSRRRAQLGDGAARVGRAIAGEVVAHLFASTTGSDADWVVKLIDVYPEIILATGRSRASS